MVFAFVLLNPLVVHLSDCFGSEEKLSKPYMQSLPCNPPFATAQRCARIIHSSQAEQIAGLHGRHRIYNISTEIF
jgi:hypothetical protein